MSALPFQVSARFFMRSNSGEAGVFGFASAAHKPPVSANKHNVTTQRLFIIDIIWPNRSDVASEILVFFCAAKEHPSSSCVVTFAVEDCCAKRLQLPRRRKNRLPEIGLFVCWYWLSMTMAEPPATIQ